MGVKEVSRLEFPGVIWCWEHHSICRPSLRKLPKHKQWSILWTHIGKSCTEIVTGHASLAQVTVRLHACRPALLMRAGQMRTERCGTKESCESLRNNSPKPTLMNVHFGCLFTTAGQNLCCQAKKKNKSSNTYPSAFSNMQLVNISHSSELK